LHIRPQAGNRLRFSAFYGLIKVTEMGRKSFSVKFFSKNLRGVGRSPTVLALRRSRSEEPGKQRSAFSGPPAPIPPNESIEKLLKLVELPTADASETRLQDPISHFAAFEKGRCVPVGRVQRPTEPAGETGETFTPLSGIPL
jgi:hypothetical protein